MEQETQKNINDLETRLRLKISIDDLNQRKQDIIMNRKISSKGFKKLKSEKSIIDPIIFR